MHSLKQGFAEQFRVALKTRFGRIPSAAFIARQVNLRFRGGQGISGETARRWLRGLAMPKYVHLGALAAWLDIDFRQVLKFSLPGDASPPPRTESQPAGRAGTQIRQQFGEQSHGQPCRRANGGQTLSIYAQDIINSLKPELQATAINFLLALRRSHEESLAPSP